MFIELTDILRCPADHEEGVLVLLPDGVRDRQVLGGHLGCMDCGEVYPIRDGAARFTDAPPPPEPSRRLTGDAVAALLGLGGPGGYVALVGGAAAAWPAFAAAVEGVHVVAVNPPEGLRVGAGVSVIRGGTIPVRGRHLRGVALGEGFASDDRWRSEALRCLLPGQRLVGEGTTPSSPALEVLASADGVWVAKAAAAGQ